MVAAICTAETRPIDVPAESTTPSIVLPEQEVAITFELVAAKPEPTMTLTRRNAVSVATQLVTGLTENPSVSHAATIAAPVPSVLDDEKEMLAAKIFAAPAPTKSINARVRADGRNERFGAASAPRPRTVPWRAMPASPRD